jgi:hypothetical protein
MSPIEMMAARVAAGAVAEGGGYLTYEQYEIAVKPRLFHNADQPGAHLVQKIPLTLYWPACSGMNPNRVHNTMVVAAAAAVKAGLLDNDGQGYRLLVEQWGASR